MFLRRIGRQGNRAVPVNKAVGPLFRRAYHFCPNHWKFRGQFRAAYQYWYDQNDPSKYWTIRKRQNEWRCTCHKFLDNFPVVFPPGYYCATFKVYKTVSNRNTVPESFLPSFCLSCSTILIGSANIKSIVSSDATVSCVDICRQNTTDDISQVRYVVHIGEGRGDKDISFIWFRQNLRSRTLATVNFSTNGRKIGQDIIFDGFFLLSICVVSIFF